MHVIAVTAEGVPTIASLFAVLTESVSPILPRSLIRFDIEDGAFTVRTALWADGFSEAVLSDGTRCYRWGGQVARMMRVRAERKGRGLVVTVTLDIDNGEIEKARFAEIVRRNVKRKYGAGELIEVEVEGNF